MISTLFKKKIEIEPYVFKTKSVLLQPVQVESSGVISISNEFKAFDFADGSLDIKSTDFSISNLNAVGAFDKLKTTFMCASSTLSVADQFQNLHYVSEQKA